MKVWALVLIASTAAWGQDLEAGSKPDSPLLTLDDGLAPDPAGEFAAGATVPFNAVCMGTGTAVRNAQRTVACEATLEEAKKDFLISKPVLIGGIAAVFVAGLAIGVAAAWATRK